MVQDYANALQNATVSDYTDEDHHIPAKSPFPRQSGDPGDEPEEGRGQLTNRAGSSSPIASIVTSAGGAVPRLRSSYA